MTTEHWDDAEYIKTHFFSHYGLDFPVEVCLVFAKAFRAERERVAKGMMEAIMKEQDRPSGECRYCRKNFGSECEGIAVLQAAKEKAASYGVMIE